MKKYGVNNKRLRVKNYNGLIVTIHAQERAYQRLNITCWKTLGEKALKALNEGINACLDETLRPLCFEKALATSLDGVYCHEGNLYLFKENALITVMPVSFLNEFNNWHGQKAA